MYEIQKKVNALSEKIDDLRNEIKKQLTKKQITFAPDDSLRKLIRLIPHNKYTVNLLYLSLANFVSAKLSNNTILFSGGRTNASNYTNLQKQYSLVTGVFTDKLNLPWNTAYHSGCNINRSLHLVFIAGGISSKNKAIVFNNTTNTIATKNQLPYSTHSHSITQVNGNPLISGGTGNSGDLSNQYMYTLSSDSYTAKCNLPQGSDCLATESITTNNVSISGGNLNNNNLNCIWSNTSNAITNKTNLSVPRWSHTVTKSSENKALFVGGIGSENINQLYDASADTFTNKRNLPRNIKEHCTKLFDNKTFLISGGNTNKQICYKLDENKFYP